MFPSYITAVRGGIGIRPSFTAFLPVPVTAAISAARRERRKCHLNVARTRRTALTRTAFFEPGLYIARKSDKAHGRD